jgi:hypothetical protein
MDLGEMHMGAMHDSEMPMMAGLGQYPYEQGMSTGMKLLIGAAVVGAGYYFFMRKKGARVITVEKVGELKLAQDAVAATATAAEIPAIAGSSLTIKPVLKVDGVEKTDAKFKVVSTHGGLAFTQGSEIVVTASADPAYVRGSKVMVKIQEANAPSGVTPAEQEVEVSLGQMNWDTQTLMGLGSMAQYRYAGGGGGIYTAPRGGADYYGGRGYTYGTQNPFAAG